VVHELNGNALIYDSHGVSGTSLLSSLAQIFCDPYYRTFEGFKILVHKDWVFYKHNFTKKNLMLR
jgi:myotubularin-related protein 6/7/8